MDNNKLSGRESEWNEANFKSMRLNSIQTLINFFHINPLGFTEGTWNYILLQRNIKLLYGEGQSKYSKSEKDECIKLIELSDKMLKLMPPHNSIHTNDPYNEKISFTFNQSNFDKLMELLFELEMKIKDYNDHHGLTTKNKGTAGLFG